MKYGRFSRDSREYIITRPDTPRPWFNYLFNDVYHCLISQTGGGFSYYRDPKYYRILRYDHLSNDRSGRYLYLKDLGTGKLWTPNWQPIRKRVSGWSCRHGIGTTTIRGGSAGVSAEITYFVTRKDPVELWRVKLVNHSKKTQRLKVYPFVDLISGDVALETHYRNILMLYNEADFDRNARAIVSTKLPFKDWHRPGHSFFATTLPVEAWETNREDFVGPYRDLDAPAGLTGGRLHKRPTRGEDMVGVFESTVTLKPGQEKVFAVILGLTEDRKQVGRLVGKYRSVGAVNRELARVHAYWEERLHEIWVETPDENFNRMTNLWGKYQLLAITHWRGTSHYHGAEGGQGYRDTCQDVEGLLSVELPTAREKLERLLFYQYASGHAVSGFSEVEGTWENQGVAGVIKKADVAVWLPYSVVSYVKETGDTKFLKKVIPFHDKGKATVYEHALRSVRYLFSACGKHGLPLIGHADWNDAYDHVGVKGKGESIWLGMALVRACRQMEELAGFIKDKKVAAEMRRLGDRMARIVNRAGWEGSNGGPGWYLAAFNDQGRKIGSRENREGKVPLNSQTWAILSGVVSEERLPKILDKIDRTLETPYGPALFLPSYTDFNPGIGRVTAFAPGTKENAAVFSHACAFKVVADCTIGRGDAAHRTFSALVPHAKHKQDHDRYKVEPYVWAEYVVGPGSRDRFGEGAFTWNTGTTPWMFIAATEWILGARREFDGLLIDPCLPKGWKKATIRRPFRGAVYQITIRNPHGVNTGVKRVVVDGRPIEGNLIKPHGDGKVHTVLVEMGRPGKAGWKGLRRPALAEVAD